MADPTTQDADLVRRAQAGDVMAWGTLCHRHAAMLAAYLGGRLGRADVVDRLVSQAIISGWRNLRELDSPEGFTGWWRRLAGGLATAWHREHPNEPLQAALPTDRLPTDPAGAEAVRHIDAALARLDEADRRLLELIHRGDLAVDQAAAILGRPDGPAAAEQALGNLVQEAARAT
jgi:DNA-directed RNA polymerase specialized sigma24 family protein